MDENYEKAIEKLKEVRGFLVVLPLRFLEDSIDATSLVDYLAITKGGEESEPVITYWWSKLINCCAAE